MNELLDKQFDRDIQPENPKKISRLQNELQEILKSKEGIVACCGKTKPTVEEMKNM
jgi:hypothetical protein